jgi:hypothetical protein
LVGNSGNWSDLTHWTSGTGGAYGKVPGTSDNVFFDNSSFSIGGQIVTVDDSATMTNLDFTGVTNNPDFAGTLKESMTVSGNILFVVGFTHSFLGDYLLTGVASQNVTSAGQSFNNNIRFYVVVGDCTLQDAISVKGALEVENGIFNSNGEAIQTGFISTNR